MHIQSRFLVALAVVLAACGGSSSGPTPPPSTALDRVVVTPTTIALSAGQQQSITAQGQTSAGDPIAATTFTYSSGSPSVASVSTTGQVTGLTTGTSTITVTGTAGGVSRTATVVATISGSLPNAVTVVAASNADIFTPANVAIVRGGTVTWSFGARPHNVTFGGQAGAPANIPTPPAPIDVARTFNTSGNFDYNCSLHQGMNGNVVVQ